MKADTKTHVYTNEYEDTCFIIRIQILSVAPASCALQSAVAQGRKCKSFGAYTKSFRQGFSKKPTWIKTKQRGKSFRVKLGRVENASEAVKIVRLRAKEMESKTLEIRLEHVKPDRLKNSRKGVGKKQGKKTKATGNNTKN